MSLDVFGQITFSSRFVVASCFTALVPLDDSVIGPDVFVELAFLFVFEATIKSWAAMFLSTLLCRTHLSL